MKIEQLLKLQVKNDNEMLGMILSNRITHYLGDNDGATICRDSKEFGTACHECVKCELSL